MERFRTHIDDLLKSTQFDKGLEAAQRMKIAIETYANEQVIEELERTVNFLSPNWTYSDIRNEILIKISILKQKQDA